MLEDVGPWIKDAIAERAGLSSTSALFVVPMAILLGSFALGVVTEHALARALGRAASTKIQLDNVLARALRGPIRGFAIFAGFGLALLVIELPARAHALTRTLLGLLLGLTLLVVAARLAAGLVETYGAHARLEGPARNVARRVSTIGIWSLGVLLVLQQQGINVTSRRSSPRWASRGSRSRSRSRTRCPTSSPASTSRATSRSTSGTTFAWRSTTWRVSSWRSAGGRRRSARLATTSSSSRTRGSRTPSSRTIPSPSRA